MIKKIQIQPALLLYLASIALLRSWQACAGAAAALVLHEAGHLLAGHALGERFERIELTPFGGVMTYAGGTIPAKGLRGAAIAAAGPAANYAMLALLGQRKVQEALGGELTRCMISSNAAMLLVNLLPALPLDGGRIAMCALGAMTQTGAAIRMLTGLGVLSGLAMAGFGVYGGVRYGIVNVSLLIVGMYLAVCAAKSRQTAAAENLYALAGERRMRDVQRLALYRVSPDVPMHRLAGALAGREGAALLCETEAGTVLVGEDELCRMMTRSPGAAVGEMIKESEKMGGAAVKIVKSP